MLEENLTHTISTHDVALLATYEVSYIWFDGFIYLNEISDSQISNF